MRLLDGFCGVLAFVSGLVLLGLIGLTFVDVVLRYVFSAPILGSKDLLEAGMVLVFSLAVPFTWRTGGHIVVDLIPDFGFRPLNAMRDLGVRFVGVGVFGVLSWRAWLRSEDAVLFNEATNMIEIPFEPLFQVLAAAAAFQAIVIGVETVRIARGLPVDCKLTWTETDRHGPRSG